MTDFDGSYYAKDRAVWRKPLQSSGGISMGFCVATLCDGVNDEGAQEIADALNATDAAMPNGFQPCVWQIKFPGSVMRTTDEFVAAHHRGQGDMVTEVAWSAPLPEPTPAPVPPPRDPAEGIPKEPPAKYQARPLVREFLLRTDLPDDHPAFGLQLDGNRFLIRMGDLRAADRGEDIELTNDHGCSTSLNEWLAGASIQPL